MAGRWLDVPGAAAVLGISTDAVRKRIARGTLRSDTQDGRRVVWLDEGGSDESGTLKSETPARDALIEAKDETIRVLREQLEAERRANEENRRIIAGLTSRIPQLEPPREAQEDVQEPSEGEARVEDRGEPEKRSWWRRFFGSPL